MRTTILAVSSLLSVSLTQEALALQRTTLPADVSYEILRDETVPNVKRSVDVRLNRRISTDVVRAIANEIKARDSRRYPRTFINYYLPDMDVDAGSWASSHFNPDLEIKIYGTTTEQHAALVDSSKSPSVRDVIGVWLDERPYVARRIALYRKDGKVFMESTYPDGSVGTREMTESNMGRRFDPKKPSAAGDYYVINTAGHVEIRDSEGLIATARKVSWR